MIATLVMAVDIGSSSVRASLYDAGGENVPGTESRIERTFKTSTGGASELDPVEAFNDVVSVIDGCLDRSENIDGAIRAVTMACFWHSLMGLGQDGNPTTPVLGWADTRSGKWTAELRNIFDERTVHNRVGARFHSSFWPAKLLRLRNEYPGVWARTASWVSFSDYVLFRVTSRLETSLSMASGTGLFDIRKAKWDRELREYLQITEAQLPGVADQPARLGAEFAKRWPRLAEAKVHPPIADGAANSIGSGCTIPSSAALMLGTSGAIRVIYEGDPPQVIPDGLWCYRIDSKRVILGGALSDGGNLIEMLLKDLGVSIIDLDLPGAEWREGTPPLVMPFFFGERSTGYHENAHGAILGRSDQHTDADVISAAMAGVAFRFAEIRDQLKSVVPVDEMILSGGAIDRFPAWANIIADVLGRDLVVSEVREATSRGAVLHALGLAATEFEGSNIVADSRHHSRSRELRERHRKAYAVHFGEG